MCGYVGMFLNNNFNIEHLKLMSETIKNRGGNAITLDIRNAESQEENSVDFDPDFDLTVH